jgi:hypothetical protein
MVDGQCKRAYQATGKYPSQSACQAACVKPPPPATKTIIVGWDVGCANGTAVVGTCFNADGSDCNILGALLKAQDADADVNIILNAPSQTYPLCGSSDPYSGIVIKDTSHALSISTANGQAKFINGQACYSPSCGGISVLSIYHHALNLKVRQNRPFSLSPLCPS